MTPGLFRRGRNRPNRADAFAEIFRSASATFEAAILFKPEWRAQWSARAGEALPPKYELLDSATVEAVYDMRFARNLLQRNRWRSAVEPLFSNDDRDAWTKFASVSAMLPDALQGIRDRHEDLLLEDELDWLDDSIEQLDEASRWLTRSTTADGALSHLIAESVYQQIYLSIQLVERFIERVRMEAAERKR